jgi:predicted ATPase
MTRANQPVPFVTRVRIQNFRSVMDVDVALGSLTVLVGLNASGKSNFLDALRFTTDALTGGLSQAVADRGGIRSVWHQSSRTAPSNELIIDLELSVRAPERNGSGAGAESITRRARYGFALRADPDEEGQSRPVVEREWCETGAKRSGSFVVERGHVVEGPRNLVGPAADPYNLLLPAIARWVAFGNVYGALRAMSFYLFSPSAMRQIEVRSGQRQLGASGERLGEILGYLARQSLAVKARIDDYIAAVVPGALGVDEYQLADRSTVRLRAVDSDRGEARYFGPESISDGTLNAAGLLAALFQPDSLAGRLPLIGIEEPELGLHPTAAGVLFDALTEASEHVQVIAATQSGDLLDREDFPVDAARVVQMRDGATTVGEVDDGGRAVVARRLATLGELMRTNQLTPRPTPSNVLEDAR